MNIGELKKQLEQFDDDTEIELVVAFDECHHVQNLKSIHYLVLFEDFPSLESRKLLLQGFTESVLIQEVEKE